MALTWQVLTPYLAQRDLVEASASNSRRQGGCWEVKTVDSFQARMAMAPARWRQRCGGAAMAPALGGGPPVRSAPVSRCRRPSPAALLWVFVCVVFVV